MGQVHKQSFSNEKCPRTFVCLSINMSVLLLRLRNSRKSFTDSCPPRILRRVAYTTSSSCAFRQLLLPEYLNIQYTRTPSPVGSSVLITSKNSCDPPSARSNANWYANSLLPGTSDVSSGIVSDDEPSVTRMRVRDWT